AAADTVGAMPAGLAVVAHDADIEPDQRAGIAIGRARCPYDLDVLAFASDRQAHLLDAWIERTRETIGGLEERHLGGKRHGLGRIEARIKLDIRARRLR